MTANVLERPETETGTADASLEIGQLWKRYHSDAVDGNVEEDIVKNYLPLVKTVVGRLAMTLPPHVDLEDLYSSGLVGLLNAIRKYDPTSKASFESYARVRIRGSVIDELRRLDWVPRSLHSKARKVKTAMMKLEQEMGRTPTDAEMAKELEISIDEYLNLLTEIKPASFISIDSVSSSEEGEGASFAESVADERLESPEDGASRRELAQLIADQLEQLPEMQRKVLALYYFEDLRLREIAEVFGLTESRICQIHAQAITSIKSYLKRHEAVPA